MAINTNYGSYAANYTNTANSRKSEETKTTFSAKQTTNDYIRSMEQKYGVKISLVDFSNEKQANAYIMGSSGGNNIAIASNIAEKIAKDPAVAAKYENVIADVPNASKIMEEGIASHDAEMVACGVSIDKDGKVSYWSVSKHKSPKDNSYKEKLKKQTEEKRAKKKEEEKTKEKRLAKAETFRETFGKTQNNFII